MGKKPFRVNVTQTELAEILGISQMTVSRALSDRPGVSQELRDKILEAVDEYGYVPDYIASGLRMKTANVIGLVVPDVSDSFFPEIAKIIENEAKESGFSVILAHSHESYDIERSEIQLLRGYRVRGLIIAPSGDQTQIDVYEQLQALHIPFVLIDRLKEGIECSCVATDTEMGTLQLGRYLIQKGYETWGYLRGPRGVSFSEFHSRGLRASLKESGRGRDAMVSVMAGFAVEDGYRATRKLMNKARVDVIIAVNDLVAVGAYRFLKEAGLRVPGDIALVGFSDLKFMDLIEAPLTTVRENISEMGRTAIELLLHQISRPADPPRKVLLEPELIVRQSA